ncbi:MAG: M48 family metallopeptidase [Patescibacteria group bacterium]
MDITYSVRISKKARRIRLTVYHDGSCVVTLPSPSMASAADTFVKQKSSWIQSKILRFQKLGPRNVIVTKRGDYQKYKGPALEFVRNKLEKFNSMYGFTYNKISIKSQRTRWGSCSRKGNLNFNYKIMLLPEKLAEYIVIHELCHLGEHNHGKKFWELVARAMPDYKEARRELSKTGSGIM